MGTSNILAIKEPRYKIETIQLTGKPPKKIELAFPADHVLFMGGSSNLNTDNVRIAFNDPVTFIPLSKVTLAKTPTPVLQTLYVDWDPSENGKYFKIYYSGAPGIEVGANMVTITGDVIGVAKEATLQLIKSSLDRFQFTSDGSLKVTAATAIVPNIDVPLSTRATEATLSGIKIQTDKLTFDTNNNLKVNASVVANPPNLDISLSSLSNKFPSATALADNLSNPTTTIIGVANLGFDGTYWRRLVTDTSGRLRVSADVVSNPPNLDISLSTINSKFPSATALADNLSNPTTTIIGAANLGFDGTYWRRLATDTSGRLRVSADVVANPSNLDVALSSVKSLFTPIVKASIFNASVSANTNILSSDVSPTYSPTTFRIYATFSASGVLTVRRTKSGTTVSEQLNGGIALNANASYIFDIIVESGETINLQYSVAATALVLKIIEVPNMTA